MELSISSVGALSEVQWGINEVASSIYVAKYIGSLISRKTDSDFFNVLEREFDVKVKVVAPWLENVLFRRRFTIRAEGFRQIEGAVCMEDVAINQLQGIATLVVLCCRYILDEKSISALLEGMLSEGFQILEVDKLRKQGLPFTTKSLLTQFIRATIDSDRTSLQSQGATTMMSGLLLKIDSPWKSFSLRTKGQQYRRILQLIGVLVGGSTVLEDIEKDKDVKFALPSGQRIYDTMAVECAFVALAAAANGADVAVVCKCEDKDVLIPQTGRHCKFLVRLWIRQPPEEISRIISYAEHDGTELEPNPDADRAIFAAIPVTIFGGQVELLQACCKRFACRTPSDELLVLFQRGFNYGMTIPITVPTRPKRTRERLDLRFSISVEKARIDRSADQLSRSFQKILPDLGDFTRVVARMVDEHFRLSDYGDDYIPEMRLTLAAVTIGLLDKITRADDSRTWYAVSGSALDDRGDFESFIPSLVKSRTTVYDLVWAAANLWGGVSYSRFGQGTPDGDIVGLVAPHCNILLDVVRNPIQFVSEGLQGKLLYMCRGSLPTVARNPGSGFITVVRQREELRQPVGAVDQGESRVVSPSGAPRGDIALTFEPDPSAESPYQSALCCWYYGQLTFQISPQAVFANLFARGTETTDDRPTGSSWKGATDPSAVRLIPPRGTAVVREITWMEMLSLEHFKIDKDAPYDVAVARAAGWPGWLVALLGLADPEHCVFQREGELRWDRPFLQRKDVVVLSG